MMNERISANVSLGDETHEFTITVEKEGYFPWDELVEADRKPLKLRVKLEPIPD